MQPNHYDLLSHGPDGTPEARPSIQMTREGYQMARDTRTGSRNQSGAIPMRSEDSWIEVSSQPSSSSLSSAATNDEIVTTGLRVERQESESQHFRSRRKRRFAASSTQVSYSSREPSIASSSQDEYEESESESDRVLSSSNEDIITRSRGDALLLRTGSLSETTSSSDDDDRSTALGLRISPSPFVPQPNVFSHPPASQTYHSRVRPSNRSQPSPSVVSNSSQSTAIRHSSSSSTRTARRERQQHSPYNMISPSYQADHDAALWASLSTLLSCAAAARGLPKNDSPPAPAGPSTGQPTSFRLVPESVAMGEESSDAEDRSTRSNTDSPSSAPHRLSRQHKPARSDASPTVSKAKRKTASSKDRSSSHASASKKSRRSNLAESVSMVVSPTVMTWVISAGVVVLFSAISFSAGYALGREVGRTEANGGMGSVLGGSGSDPFSSAKASVGCGKEAVKGGLKRLRWGAAGGSGVSIYN
ncbi:hypothetical protein VTN96DRAFT_8064 [Rasamsonia emersonii]